MRDPFDSAPALRLGDAPAKRLIAESRAARETGIVPNAEIVAVELPKTDTAIPRPPSLDPAFGDAFGEALSKPKTHRDGLVDWIEKHGAYWLGVDLGSDDVTITGVVRKPVGDGATRYEPAPRLFPSFREVDAEVLSEEEFARRYPGPVPMIRLTTPSAEEEAFVRLYREAATEIAKITAEVYESFAPSKKDAPKMVPEQDRYLATLSGAIGIPEGELRDILNRNYGPKFPIDHGDTSAASLVANHEMLVGKAPK